MIEPEEYGEPAACRAAALDMHRVAPRVGDAVGDVAGNVDDVGDAINFWD